jgi:hypothetical protein
VSEISLKRDVSCLSFRASVSCRTEFSQQWGEISDKIMESLGWSQGRTVQEIKNEQLIL